MAILAGEIQLHADIIIVPGGAAHSNAPIMPWHFVRRGEGACDLPQPADPRQFRSLLPCQLAAQRGHPNTCIVAQQQPAFHPPLRAGADIYRNLPFKTLQLLHYALSSECKYTHVLKTDDDVYLRPQVRSKPRAGGREFKPVSWLPTELGSSACDVLPCCCPFAAAVGHHPDGALQLQRGSAERRLK